MRAYSIGLLLVCVFLAGCTGGPSGPCVPCGPEGCAADTKPCTCWPDYAPAGQLTAGQMLSAILQEATVRSNRMQCPMSVRSAWAAVKYAAEMSLFHGPTCMHFTCQQQWDKVNGCYQGIFGGPPIPPCGYPPQLCSELNHDDPVPYSGTIQTK